VRLWHVRYRLRGDRHTVHETTVAVIPPDRESRLAAMVARGRGDGTATRDVKIITRRQVSDGPLPLADN
jgi:hypothetical protein